MRFSLTLLFLSLSFSSASLAGFGLCKWVYKTPTKHEINLELAERSGLRYLESPEEGIRRNLVTTRQKDQRTEYVFKYVDPQGKTIEDEATLARIKKLRIPPAYKDVWISTDSKTHIQARGVDDRGRTQVRMHELWQSQVKDVRKFTQAAEFGQALPKLHRVIDQELSSKTLTENTKLAAVVRLLETAGIRIGNEKYAQENGSFGLTTLRVSHVVANTKEVRFIFVGKEGVNHDIAIQDPALIRTIRALVKGKSPDDLVFDVSDSSVNDFIKQHTSPSFSAKDFRTWVANVEAVRVLISGGTEKDAAVAVSKRLTNEPGTARDHYISPKVFEMFRDGRLEELSRKIESPDRPLEETLAIRVLSETSL